ncbi:hypothetical protein [Sorangium sp. So ce1000]|uniref:hypothetical protein n=1 Tax=Sorangium sp. So ce1000 TaxID=3133325 RepID=UPI003F5DC443
MSIKAKWMIVISGALLAVGCAAGAPEDAQGEGVAEPRMERIYLDAEGNVEEGDVGESTDELRRCLCCDLIYNVCSGTCGEEC